MKKVRLITVLLVLMMIFVGCTDTSEQSDNGAATSPPAASTSQVPAETAAGEESLLNETGLPITNEVITVTTLYPRRPQHQENFDEMWFNKELTQRTNIHIEYDLVESSGYQERKNLVLATGDYPDVFFDGITKNDEQIYGPQGVFVDLSGYIDEYASTMLSLFELYPDVRKSITYEDGSIYNMPCFNIVPRDQVAGAGFMNTTWVENLGLEMPETLDDLYNIMVAFKENDANGNGDNGDEIPFLYPMSSSTTAGDFFKIQVLAAYGTCGAVDTVEDGKYIFVPMEDNYKRYLEFMNKLYTEKLLSHDSLIMSREEYNAKLQDMTVGIMDTSTPYQVIPADEDWMQYERIPMLTSDINSENVWPGNLRHTRAWGNFVMTDKCQYPEAMVRMVDYFYTDEGTLMVRSGPEEGTWEGEGGWKIVEEDGKKKSVITWGDFDSFYLFRLYNAPLNFPYSSNEYMNFVMISGDYKNSWLSESILSTGRLEVAQIPYPEVSFTTEEQEAMTVYVDIENYFRSMEIKFITGEEPLSNWVNYIDTLNSMGIQNIIKIKQNAYDRWNAK